MKVFGTLFLTIATGILVQQAEGLKLPFLSGRQTASGIQQFGLCSLEETQDIFVDYPSQCYSAFNDLHNAIETNTRDQTTYQEVFTSLCSEECTNQIGTFTQVCQAYQYAEPVLHACDRDPTSGDYCLALVNKNNGTQAARDCYTVEATGHCSESCKASLEQLTTDIGCCINTLFNATTYGLETLQVASHKLWSTCGIDSISLCDNPVLAALSGTPTLQLPLVLIFLLTIIPAFLF